MGNRMEQYGYPSYVGATVLASVLLLTGALGQPAVFALLTVAGLIALVQAIVGQRDRGNASPLRSSCVRQRPSWPCLICSTLCG
jgi:hypothetical protein